MQDTLVGPREHWDELRSAFREFFKTPDDALFDSVRADLAVLSLKAGEVLVREDERSDELFFVVSGRLRAVRRRGQMKQRLGEIVRGETVGELGLITGEVRSATVLAVRDSLVARMNLADLTGSDWTRVCLRRADEILLVAAGFDSAVEDLHVTDPAELARYR